MKITVMGYNEYSVCASKINYSKIKQFLSRYVSEFFMNFFLIIFLFCNLINPLFSSGEPVEEYLKCIVESPVKKADQELFKKILQEVSSVFSQVSEAASGKQVSFLPKEESSFAQVSKRNGETIITFNSKFPSGFSVSVIGLSAIVSTSSGMRSFPQSSLLREDVRSFAKARIEKY
jgi:hypothetical protein